MVLVYLSDHSDQKVAQLSQLCRDYGYDEPMSFMVDVQGIRCEKLSVSAPGSVVLFGEHAVLHGYSAIGMAINKRLTVTLSDRTDGRACIHSTLGHYVAPIDTLVKNAQHRFVLDVLKKWYEPCKKGITIEIASKFSSKVGLGSSGALLVALISALYQKMHGNSL